MTLLLTNEDVEQVLTMDLCIEVLEEAFKELGQGTAKNRHRTHLYVPTEDPEISYRFKSMEGAVPKYKTLAIRLCSDLVRYPKVGGLVRQVKVPAARGKQYLGLVQLFDMTSSELYAIIQDGFLQKMRVGATSAIGAKYLARKDAKVLGMFGSGWQASAHILAFSRIRKLEKVKVYSTNPAHRQAFSKEMASSLGIEVIPVDTPKDCVVGTDMVITATNSNEPVFEGTWLSPGMHVGSIANSDEAYRRTELDATTLRRADILVINSREQVEYAGQEEILELIAKGFLSWDRIYELGKLLCGEAPCRTSDQQITVFKNNVGLGIQFAAVGAKVYQLGRERGLGKEIPTEWFLEKVHP